MGVTETLQVSISADMLRHVPTKTHLFNPKDKGGHNWSAQWPHVLHKYTGYRRTGVPLYVVTRTCIYAVHKPL
ncbi:hypothetical protein SCLCIDRAFT_1020010 [Scleroderma citrinum Foug A]|uniref:Uncharacterized protein n=1 Tax=Scleroderma citrinum Foug A TaxID=1036808 RepID=A0A0C3DTW2_9AGAM|nr:hypothetical protein SCLCIDRAFT_1020010 [Scleroderma citrinum Foug A]